MRDLQGSDISEGGPQNGPLEPEMGLAALSQPLSWVQVEAGWEEGAGSAVKARRLARLQTCSAGPVSNQVANQMHPWNGFLVLGVGVSFLPVCGLKRGAKGPQLGVGGRCGSGLRNVAPDSDRSGSEFCLNHVLCDIGPQFPHMQNGDSKSPCLFVRWRG